MFITRAVIWGGGENFNIKKTSGGGGLVLHCERNSKRHQDPVLGCGLKIFSRTVVQILIQN